MYTPEQQAALDRMREYLQSATPEQLQADLERVAAWSHVGPTWDEYVSGLSNMLAQRRKPMNRIRKVAKLKKAGVYKLSVLTYVEFNQVPQERVEEAEALYGHE